MSETKPHEAFGMSAATINDFELFGVRTFRLTPYQVEIDSFFLQVKPLEDGKLEIRLRTKDADGRVGTMYVTQDVRNWQLHIDGGEYKKGTTFTYRATLDGDATATFETEYQDEPGNRVTVPA